MRRVRDLRAALAAALALSALLGLPQAVAAQGAWRLEQPPPPPGARFKVALGAPGDLEFYSRNRGLLSVEGNSTVPRGLYSWNGESWHQLATVCGGPGDTSRIAFAGPNEFWTVSEPSRPRIGSGTALCRFKDGQVVGSYSTPEQSADPFRQMDAAACNGPNDCWFGGFGARSPSGERRGAFHLHWDGRALQTIYAPFGRGVTDIEFHGGDFVESTLLGKRPENREPVDPPEAGGSDPRLLRRIGGGAFAADPFTVRDDPESSELLALDSDGARIWAGGGGAASGIAAPADGTSFARPPVAVYQDGGAFTEVPIDPLRFGVRDRFADIAAVPGTNTAWAAVQPFDLRTSRTAKAQVARITPSGVAEIVTLPGSGGGRGVAARIAFTAPNDGWMVTQAGWLFHYTDGERVARDDDPAWQGTITFRPNEAAEQFVPDTPPADDSALLAPPPVEIETPATATESLDPLPPVVKGIRTKLRGLTLYVSFRLVRRARVQIVARKGRKVVARTKNRLLRRGKHTLKLKLNRKRYPTRLQFKAREPGVDYSGGDADTITTPEPGASTDPGGGTSGTSGGGGTATRQRARR